MGALAVLQGLGRVGNEVYGAKQLALDEQAKKLALLQSQLGLQDLRQRIGMGQQEMGLKSNQEKRAQEEFELKQRLENQPKTIGWQIIGTKGIVLQQNPDGSYKYSQTDLSGPQDASYMKLAKDIISSVKDPQKQRQMQDEFGMSVIDGDLKGGVTKLQQEADKATSHEEHEEDLASTRAFQKQEHEDNRAFQREMVDVRLQEKQKFMSPQERNLYDNIKRVDPAVNNLIKFIEDNKLQDENNFVLGSRSALMNHIKLFAYRKGVDPDKISSQLIKDAAGLQVLGAAPWMTIGRGKYLYETIVQHLPQPYDTPKNLYSKVTWLRDNMLVDAKNSLADYVQPGINPSSVNITPGGDTATTPTVLDPETKRYLNSIGVKTD